MPIYEYHCPECGSKFEKLVRFGSDAPARCPNCDGENAQRLISTFAMAGGGAAESAPASSCGTGT